MELRRDLARDTVVVALSGGVDSSVAAALLVEAGHRVVGITMRLYDASGTSAARGRCCGPLDIEDARQVCAVLGIPFYVANYQDEFRRAVIDDFVAEYTAGRTPNPCVRCNEKIKFAPLLKRARALGATRLATGHYARLARGADGRLRIRRAVDADKDQSYFLFAAPSDDLEQVIFPLGEMTKAQVRGVARRLRLPNADKDESQEICFVPDGDHAALVARLAAERPAGGEIVDLEGRRLGDHDGIHHFTIGQRRGIGVPLGGGEPGYVVSVDALRRRVVVGPREALRREEIRVADVRWPAAPPAEPLAAAVQVRHRHRPVAARIHADGDLARAVLDQPMDGAAAPGQAAVFYDGDVVVGGGWITM
jgi:tRNA-uridine 2-sulfurtransferase